MKNYKRNLLLALLCFVLVVVLNFFLPRMLPGDPVAYLTGYAEEDMTPAQSAYYREALHLDESLPRQFGYYLRSLADGTLGYSYKKDAAVSQLISRRLGATLQIAVPAVVLSGAVGLFWGLYCGYHRGKAVDRLSTALQIVVNTAPAFLTGLLLMAAFCFRLRWLPYTGLSSPGAAAGSPGFVWDRLRHLLLPVLTLTIAAAPSRFLLVRNAAAREMDEKYVLYARQRGLSPRRIRLCYILKNIAQPFVHMVGLSVSTCIGGSLVVENIFSINGMGTLLSDAVYSLDYPLMQGVLFVTTAVMALAMAAADAVCLVIDPRVRLREAL